MNIPHSKPFLPPLEQYQQLIAEVWSSGWLTNHGPKLQAFEKAIAQYLGLPYVSYVSSGTTGLQCALRTLPRGGEVITTAYSYVATAGAVFWEGFTPVFADVALDRLSANPEDVAQLINPRTRAILITHVYGVPAHTEALQALSDAHNIPLIYDAAHAFGVMHQGKSLLSYGHFSILSLHATKIFHTANGGLVVSHTAKGKAMIDGYRNFGHDGPNHFKSPGINGKNSELHAALGLALLPYADALLKRRAAQWLHYKNLLSALPAKHFLQIPDGCDHNGAYFPLLHLRKQQSVRIASALSMEGIEARRYFSPALNTIAYMRGAPCPLAEALAETVLCLPLFHTMDEGQQAHIAHIILQHFHS